MFTERTYNSAGHYVMGCKVTSARKAIAVLIAIILIIIYYPISVAAQVTPSIFSINSALVCRSLIEENDFLLIAHYNITYYTGQPSTDIDEFFHFKLLSADGGTLIGTAKPYPYQNSGYDQGVVGWYFSAADAPAWDIAYIIQVVVNPLYYSATDIYSESFSVTTGAGETSADVTLTEALYDDNTTYVISATSSQGTDVPAIGAYNAATQELTITGLSASLTRTLSVSYYYESTTEINFGLTTDNYSSFTEHDDNKTLLGDYIIDVAQDLEVNWGVEMVTEGKDGLVLNSTGESYFTGSISGIKEMSSDIFFSTTGSPDYSGPDWGTEQADTYGGRYTGTWVGDSLDDLGEFLGVPGQIATSLIMVAFIAFLFGMSQKLFFTTTPALIASENILLCSFVMGFVSPSIMAVTVFMFLLFIAYVLFFRSAS